MERRPVISNKKDKKLTPYSVGLLYPDYVAEDGGELYYDFVRAHSPAAAVKRAQRKACLANEMTLRSADDFRAVLVLPGHHKCLNQESDEPLSKKYDALPPLTIEVRAGCVAEITGIPPGLVVVVVDHDTDNGEAARYYYEG